MDRSKANVNYSTYRALKLEETWNGNGMVLHEVYWDTMGGDGKPTDKLEVIKKIKEDFGLRSGLEGRLHRGGEVREGMGRLFD